MHAAPKNIASAKKDDSTPAKPISAPLTFGATTRDMFIAPELIAMAPVSDSGPTAL
jgi:hypothetical protein